MKRVLVGSLLALASIPAMAADDVGFYASVSGGQSKYDLAKGDLDSIGFVAFAGNGVFPFNPASSFDDSGSAWSIAGGYKFSPNVAFEVGYVDLGSAKYRSTGQATFFGVPGIPSFTPVAVGVNIDFASRGLTAAAIGMLPLGTQFDVHGFLGSFISDTTIDIDVRIANVTTRTSLDGQAADLFAGLGAAFHFSKTFALSLDYSLFKDVGDGESTGEGDIDSIRLAAQYRF